MYQLFRTDYTQLSMGRTVLRSCCVGWQDGKSPSLKGHHAPEGSLIEGEDASGLVTPSKDRQRAIGQPELQAPILARQVPGDLQLALAQALHPKGPICKIVEKGQFNSDPQSIKDQEVCLSNG